MSIRSQRFARATLALGSLIVGWACGYGYFALVMIYLSDWGRVTDGTAIAAWTAIFVAIGWLLFAAPVAVLADPRRRVFALRLCPLFGASYGLVAARLRPRAEAGQSCCGARFPHKFGAFQRPSYTAPRTESS